MGFGLKIIGLGKTQKIVLAALSLHIVTNKLRPLNCIWLLILLLYKALAAMSTSVGIREKGSALFRQAFYSTEWTPAIRLERAKSALNLFTQAKFAASRDGDGKSWVYAVKNYGVTCSMIVENSEFVARLTTDMVMFYYQEGLCSLLEAKINGKTVSLPQEWQSKLQERILRTIDSLSNFIVETYTDWRMRCSKIGSFILRAQACDVTTASLHVITARQMIKQVIVSSEGDDSRVAFSILNELLQPIAFARQYIARLEISDVPLSLIEELNDIEHSQQQYMCRVASSQQLTIGQNLEMQMLNDHEDLNMDVVMLVLDHYTQAMLASRSDIDNQSCLESEAKAAAALGAFHHNVIKTEDRGHQHLLHAIQLADTITHTSGSTFFHCEWYKKAVDVIRVYREKRLAFDQKQLSEQRAPTLEKIKPQLDALKASMTSSGKSYRCV
jgi:hypothetical protein